MFNRKKRLISIIMALVLVGSVMNYSVRIYADNDDTEESAGDNQDAESKDDSEKKEESDKSEESDKEQSESSKADTSELEASIKNKRQQITSAEAEKKKIQGSITDVKKMVASLQSEKEDLEAYVTELDADLAEIQNNITELKELIAEKENEIETTTDELAQAEATQQEQYESMKKRIKFMYEKGDTFYVEMLFSAYSFADIINKVDYIEKLSAYDSKKLEEYKTTCEYVAACKEQLEAEKEVLEEAKATVEKEEEGVEELIAAKEAEINATNADISAKEAAIKEYENSLAVQNATIAALEAAVAEEIKKLEEENGTRVTYDGGIFKHPCPSFKRMSDDYGNRIHPTLGIEKFHNGVDFAAPGGTPILAAYNGQVVAADYNASMGNYVMINHGDGLYTIYMHASALYVSKGQTVSAGSKIAAVGTTGRSTGNHLHFSVRKNGSYVSPWGYISK